MYSSTNASENLILRGLSLELIPIEHFSGFAPSLLASDRVLDPIEVDGMRIYDCTFDECL